MKTKISEKPDTVHSGRLLAPDAIRAIALLMIIMVHSSDSVSHLYGRIPAAWVWTGNILQTPSRIGVPLFFMISGWLALRKAETDYFEFFKKRFVRVIPPFLFYVGIFYLWMILYQRKTFSLRVIVSEILNFRLHIHFWFVYAIIGLYLITPVLRELVHKASRKSLFYLVGLWAVGMSVLPVLNPLFGLQVEPPLVFLVGGYVGYYLLGYLLKDVTLTKKQVWLGLVVLLVCFVVVAVGTHIRSTKLGEFDETFYDYLNPLIVLSSIIFFLLFKNIPYERLYQKSPNFKKVITHLSSISYGVYMLHPLFILLIERGTLGFRVRAAINHPLVTIPVFFGVSTLASILVVSVLRKVPGLKYFAG